MGGRTRVTTIELSPAYHAAAQARFFAQPNVRTLAGNSVARITRRGSEPPGSGDFLARCHWSGLDTASHELECPVLAEIALINASSLAHVVLVATTHTAVCAPPPRPHRAEQWPGLATIVAALDQEGRRHVVCSMMCLWLCQPTRGMAGWSRAGYGGGHPAAEQWVCKIVEASLMTVAHQTGPDCSVAHTCTLRFVPWWISLALACAGLAGWCGWGALPADAFDFSADRGSAFVLRWSDIQPYDPITWPTTLTNLFSTDAWFARKIAEQRLTSHVDVGSSARSMALIAQFVPVTFVDIRLVEIELPGFTFLRGSVLALPFADGAVSNLSSLCVIEHIGLGRYGDTFDARGSEQAAAGSIEVLASGEQYFYLSVPVDVECRVYFNAHRAFTRDYLLPLSGLELVRRYIYGRLLLLTYEPSRALEPAFIAASAPTMNLRERCPCGDALRMLSRQLFRLAENNIDLTSGTTANSGCCIICSQRQYAIRAKRRLSRVTLEANLGAYTRKILQERNAPTAPVEVHAFEPSLRCLDALRGAFGATSAVTLLVPPWQIEQAKPRCWRYRQ